MMVLINHELSCSISSLNIKPQSQGMSYYLYKINNFCIKSLLKAEGVTPTLIANTTWMHYDFLTRIIERTHRTKFKTPTPYKKGWVKICSEDLKVLYAKEYVDGNYVDRYTLIRERLQRWKLILHYTEQVDDTLRVAYYKVLEEHLEVNGTSEWSHHEDGVKAPKSLGISQDTSTPIQDLSGVLIDIRKDLDRVTIDPQVYRLVPE